MQCSWQLQGGWPEQRGGALILRVTMEMGWPKATLNSHSCPHRENSCMQTTFQWSSMLHFLTILVLKLGILNLPTCVYYPPSSLCLDLPHTSEKSFAFSHVSVMQRSPFMMSLAAHFPSALPLANNWNTRIIAAATDPDTHTGAIGLSAFSFQILSELGMRKVIKAPTRRLFFSKMRLRA